jgi:hypothetical protein
LDVPIERVFLVGLVKAMKAVRPGCDEPDRAEFAQFVLNGVKGEMTLQR